MSALTKRIVLLLSAYFLLFSITPQDYGFIEKIGLCVEKMTADSSDIESSEAQETEDEEKSKPPTLVEEEDHYVHDPVKTSFVLLLTHARYYLSNEECKGISPSIPLPPPDRIAA